MCSVNLLLIETFNDQARINAHLMDSRLKNETQTNENKLQLSSNTEC